MKMYRLYQLPVYYRFIRIGGCHKRSSLKVECRSVNGVGVVVYYEHKRQLDTELIKESRFKIKETIYTVEAEKCSSAVCRFLSENRGALIGGEEFNKKALWINNDKPILELPLCPFMRKNKDEKFICGEQVEFGYSGEFGMCIIENYKPTHYCTMVDYKDRFMKYQERYLHFAEIDKESGYKIIPANHVPLEFTPIKFIN
jgi:hypothetical protein